MKCSQCKKNFKSIRSDHVYCSDSCSSKGYSRTFHGMITIMHKSIRQRGKIFDRYILPKSTFIKIAENSVDLKELYKVWVKNNFDKSLSPSVDRRNNLLGYTENNIQFITITDNRLKGANETKDSRKSRPVGNTGIRGVVKLSSGNFGARIVINTKHIYLGTFKCPLMAYMAFTNKRRAL